MASGAKMPVNAIPIKMIQVKEGIGALIDVYTPHWGTCPQANTFKTKQAHEPPEKRWHNPKLP